MSKVSSALLALIMAAPSAPASLIKAENPVAAPTEISRSEWGIEDGDRLFVDTKENVGYLIHPDGRYLRFPVTTGQRRVVHYIGRTYNAATPTWDWEVQQLDIKGDRITFGPSGRFLRLFHNGERRTAYGIHAYKYEKEMFSKEKRFSSMGCIVVKRPMMDLLVDTFEQNGSIEVATRYGIEDRNQLVAVFGNDAS